MGHLLPFLFGFIDLISIILLSKNQIAMKGLQKKECIDIFTGFLNIKSNGKLFFLNINPLNFEYNDWHSLTFIFCSFSFSWKLKVFTTIFHYLFS